MPIVFLVNVAGLIMLACAAGLAVYLTNNATGCFNAWGFYPTCSPKDDRISLFDVWSCTDFSRLMYLAGAGTCSSIALLLALSLTRLARFVCGGNFGYKVRFVVLANVFSFLFSAGATVLYIIIFHKRFCEFYSMQDYGSFRFGPGFATLVGGMFCTLLTSVYTIYKSMPEQGLQNRPN